MHGVSTASELAVFSGGAGSARYREKDTTNADVTAVGRPAGGARPLGSEKHSTTTESDIGVSSGGAGPPRIAKFSVAAKSELAESSGGAGPSWSRAHGATSADVAAAVKSDGETRPPGEAKYRAATKFEIAEYSGEFPTS